METEPSDVGGYARNWLKSDQLGNAANFGTAWRNRGTQAAHGTRQRYKMGCHCDPCTAAGSEHRAEMRRKKQFTHDDAIDSILEVLAG